MLVTPDEARLRSVQDVNIGVEPVNQVREDDGRTASAGYFE
jgi:hypothetical protein